MARKIFLSEDSAGTLDIDPFTRVVIGPDVGSSSIDGTAYVIFSLLANPPLILAKGYIKGSGYVGIPD